MLSQSLQREVNLSQYYRKSPTLWRSFSQSFTLFCQKRMSALRQMGNANDNRRLDLPQNRRWEAQPRATPFIYFTFFLQKIIIKPSLMFSHSPFTYITSYRKAFLHYAKRTFIARNADITLFPATIRYIHPRKCEPMSSYCRLKGYKRHVSNFKTIKHCI